MTAPIDIQSTLSDAIAATPNGRVDYKHYERRARRLRSDAAREGLAMAAGGLLRALRAISLPEARRRPFAAMRRCG